MHVPRILLCIVYYYYTVLFNTSTLVSVPFMPSVALLQHFIASSFQPHDIVFFVLLFTLLGSAVDKHVYLHYNNNTSQLNIDNCCEWSYFLGVKFLIHQNCASCLEKGRYMDILYIIKHFNALSYFLECKRRIL